jgi:hypothetical protein
LELFFNSGGLFAKLWTVGQFSRNRGPALQNFQINRFPNLIFNGKFCGPSPRCGGLQTAPVHGGPQIEDAAVLRRRAARGRWSSPVTEGEDEPVEAVLGRFSPVTEEWQRGGAPEAANGGGLSSSRG